MDVLAFAFDPSLLVEHWLLAGGYLMLFGLLFACGLGLPLPEDIPLLLAGFLVAQGKMHLVPAAVLAWGGIIGGDLMLYHFGKKYGLNITRVPFIGKHVTRQRIERAEHLFENYGVWVVAVGRLIAGVRAAMVVAAGTIRYSLPRFIIADGLAAIVSGGLFLGLGYWGGRKLGDPQQLMQRIAPYKHWVFLAVLLVAAGLVAYLTWRQRRHTTLSDVLIEKAEEVAERHEQP